MHSVLLWLADALPDISGLVLVLTGLIMSLPKLAERIEKNRYARNGLSSLCILVGVYGLILSVNGRRQANQQMRDLISNMGTLVTNTNHLVTTVNLEEVHLSVLQPELMKVETQVSGLDAALRAAQGNSKLAATLTAERDAAQDRANTIARQMLLAVVPGVWQQMRGAYITWYLEDNRLIDSDASGQSSFAVTQKRRADLKKQRAQEIRPLILAADKLRQELLDQLPASAKSEEDVKGAAIFARAATGEDMEDCGGAAGYLEKLYERVSSTEK